MNDLGILAECYFLKLCFPIFRYHIPRSFLKPNSNLLVILEEEREGYPLGITIDTVSVTEVCGHVSNTHPHPVISPRKKGHNRNEQRHLKYRYDRKPKVQLQCPTGRKISKVLFATFGNPNGSCGSYSVGSCHSPNSLAVVQKVSYYCPCKFYLFSEIVKTQTRGSCEFVQACLRKSRCSVPVWSKTFGGDLCPQTVKSLLVRAQCS